MTDREEICRGIGQVACDGSMADAATKAVLAVLDEAENRPSQALMDAATKAVLAVLDETRQPLILAHQGTAELVAQQGRIVQAIVDSYEKQLAETRDVVATWEIQHDKTRQERDGIRAHYLALCAENRPSQALMDAAVAEQERRADAAEAHLRAVAEALRLLRLPIRVIGRTEPPDRLIPTQHSVADIRQADAALEGIEDKEEQEPR